MGYNGKEVPGLYNLVSHAQSSPDLMERALAKTSGSEMKLTAGSAGDDVKRLQKMLNKLGVTDVNGRALEEDGVFGRHTLEAVNTYKDAAIPGGNTGTNKGVVGPSTLGRLTFDSTFNIKPPALRNSGISAVSGGGGGGSWGDDSGNEPQTTTANTPVTNKFGVDPDALVAMAISQVGYTEKDDMTYEDDNTYGKSSNSGKGNYTKYGAYTGADGAAWCASFVSWCLKQDNEDTQISSARTHVISHGRIL
ncbi:peptidoglycan-binding domain-containing protein [Oscillospiraceae bacterium WX1]